MVDAADLRVSLLVAVARNTRSPALFPLRAFAVVYTDVFRGIPVILTIFLIGFGVPGPVRLADVEQPADLGHGRARAVVLGVRVRGAPGRDRQRAREPAGRGPVARDDSRQTMGAVVLPQAMRRVVPPLMNSLVSLQKDVALISLIGPVEILRQAGIDKAKFANFTPYVAAAVIFLALTIPCTRLADWALARERKRTGATTIA